MATKRQKSHYCRLNCQWSSTGKPQCIVFEVSDQQWVSSELYGNLWGSGWLGCIVLSHSEMPQCAAKPPIILPLFFLSNFLSWLEWSASASCRLKTPPVWTKIYWSMLDLFSTTKRGAAILFVDFGWVSKLDHICPGPLRPFTSKNRWGGAIGVVVQLPALKTITTYT